MANPPKMGAIASKLAFEGFKDTKAIFLRGWRDRPHPSPSEKDAFEAILVGLKSWRTFFPRLASETIALNKL